MISVTNIKVAFAHFELMDQDVIKDYCRNPETNRRFGSDAR